jgi:hypothetical protein
LALVTPWVVHAQSSGGIYMYFCTIWRGKLLHKWVVLAILKYLCSNLCCPILTKLKTFPEWKYDSVPTTAWRFTSICWVPFPHERLRTFSSKVKLSAANNFKV